jgi:outer membrane protein assembly factor BamB
VCDRGYHLASYLPGGSPGPTLDTDVAAVAAANDGQSLFCRKRTGRVSRVDSAGKLMWEVEVPAGRFPIPPTEAGGRLYVCSNRGLLSVLDAANGGTLWAYQATPGLYVMAPVAADHESACYVAGMDGSVTALRYRQKTRSTRQGTYRE